VTEGIELMAGWQQPYEMVSAYTTLAAIRQAQGDLVSAHEALQNAQAIQSQCPPYPTVNSMIAVGQVNLYLAQGDPAEASRQARRACLGTQSAPLLHERETITLAQIQIAQGEWSQALDRLAKLSTVATAGGREGRLIEILALQAVAYARSGDMPQALATLEKALSLAEPEGYRRVFIDRGAPMAELLQQAVAQQIAPGYADQLVATFGAKPRAREREATRPIVSPPLFEPLTPRETQVLQLLGAGYSNRQIAEELVLALNTVKKHTSNIYGKLGVRSRTQAVARARDLGLLS
jgi:LuxR family maltose regulon positive regulatory protein